jgi:hypothetical protein
MDEYNVEIEEIDQQQVVLVIRALRLIVRGRTPVEARQLATAAIAWRVQESDARRSHGAGRSCVDAPPRGAAGPDCLRRR